MGDIWFEYYTIDMIVTVLFMLGMIVMVDSNEIISHRRTVSFKCCFAMNAIAAVSEWMGVFLDGKPMNTYALHVFVKTLELSTAPLIPAVMAISAGSRRRLKPVFAVMGLNVILEVISAFTGIVFGVNGQNVYYHSTLYYSYYVFVGAGVVYLLYETYRLGKINQFWHSGTLLMVVLMLLIGMVPHFIKSEWRFEWLCAGIAISMYYMYTTNSAVVMDVLTGVFSRASYEKAIAKLSPGMMIVAFDVDDFKHINDVYGHPYGDETLKNAAKIIRTVFGKYGHCYRTGGDEFCALMGKVHPSEEKLSADLDAEIRRMQELDGRFPRISRGFFELGENGLPEGALSEADMLLYSDKRNKG